VQAEAALRRLMASTLAPSGERYTVAEAGAIYIEHLEVVMERKRTTIADYRGYLDRHLGPFFGGRPMDRIDRARVEEYLVTKKRAGLSSKTIGNHLTFLHGLWSFGVKREWVGRNVVALVDRPRQPRSRSGGSGSSRARSSRPCGALFLTTIWVTWSGRCICARR
jgi:hypothetical protein